MIVLQTRRLLLRRLVATDLDELQALYGDPEMRRHYPDGVRTPQETQAELDYFLQGHPRDPTLGLWATIDRQTGEFLGRCGLLPWQIQGRAEVEVAFMIRKQRWRQGLATEAAVGIVQHARHALGLRRLVCLVMPGNEASARVALKVGMRLEGEFSDEHGPCHLYAMALDTR